MIAESSSSSTSTPEIGRRGRHLWFTRRRLLALGVAGLVVIATAGILVYWVRLHQAGSENSRGPILLPFNFTQVTATGNANGPAGCAGPGPGKTEYCYTFGFVFQGGSLLSRPIETAAVLYATTADVNFSVRSCFCAGASNVSFVNLTLLDDRGQILATYSQLIGWSAFGGHSLPIVLWTNQTCVLNDGLTSATGGVLWINEGAWGQSETQIA